MHGKNGIGDVEFPRPRKPRSSRSQADDFIVRTAAEVGGELVIVSLGRLTNVARALRKDPELPSKVKHLYVMGGAVRVPGNVTQVRRREANIWGDPEAAEAVMQSGMAITLIGLDVTMRTLLHQSDLDRLQQTCKPENRASPIPSTGRCEYYLEFYRQSNGFEACAPLHDPLTVLAAIEPGLVATESMRLSVECEGRHCIGMTVADLRNRPAVGQPVQVAVEVDAERAVDTLMAIFDRRP